MNRLAKRFPLLGCFAAYAAGVAGAQAVTDARLAAWAAGGLLGAAALSWLLRARRLTGLLLLCAFPALGASRAHSRPPPPLSPEGARVYEAVVASYPEANPRGSRFDAHVAGWWEGAEERPLSARVRLSLFDSPPPAKGERIRFRSALRPPRNFGNDRELNFERYCRTRGIELTGSIPDRDGWVSMAPPESRVRKFLNRLRARAMERAEAFLDPSHVGLYRSLVLGELGSVPRGQIEAFRRAGILHLLVVSGSHVALVGVAAGVLAGWLLRSSFFFAQRVPIWHVRAAGALAGALFFCSLLNLSIPSLRAMVAVLAAALALFLRRPRDYFLLLSVVAFGLLLFEPIYLFDVSFQLSFGAVFGILAALELFPAGAEEAGGMGRRLLLFLRTLFLISAGAFVATLPILAWHFSRISLWSLPGNLIFVPLIGGVATPLGLAAAFLPGAASEFLFCCFDLWLAYTVPPLLWFSRLPASDLWIARPSRIALAGYLLWAASVWLRRKRPAVRPWTVRAAGATGVLLCAAPYAFRPAPADEVHFLHVGQGEATLVRTASGRHILIDAGPGGPHSFDAGERVLVPWFRTHGVDRLDLAVVTHGDADHAGGLRSVIEQIPVGEIWHSSQEEPPLLRELAAVARERGIPWRSVDASWPRRRVDGVSLLPLHPDRETALEGENDRSLVVRVEIGTYRILMTADIEAGAEEELVRRAADLHADLLKVPHHGSLTSSSPGFLGAVSPREAVVFAGWKNRYGHPREEVLRRYAERGIRVWRGDLCGEVTVQLREREAFFDPVVPCGNGAH